MTDKKTRIEPIMHSDERINIPTPELAPLMAEEDVQPIRVSYENRNPDLDPNPNQTRRYKTTHISNDETLIPPTSRLQFIIFHFSIKWL